MMKLSLVALVAAGLLGTAEPPYGLTDRLARDQDDPGLLVRPENPAAVKFASPVLRHG